MRRLPALFLLLALAAAPLRPADTEAPMSPFTQDAFVAVLSRTGGRPVAELRFSAVARRIVAVIVGQCTLCR